MELTLDAYRKRIHNRQWFGNRLTGDDRRIYNHWAESFTLLFDTQAEVSQFLTQKLGEPTYTFNCEGNCYRIWEQGSWELVLRNDCTPDLYAIGPTKPSLELLGAAESMIQVRPVERKMLGQWAHDMGLGVDLSN